MIERDSMIGFIGAGNMATALIEGMIRGGISPDTLAAYDVSAARMDAMRALGVHTAQSAVALAEMAETTVLAVKPIYMQGVLDALADAKVRDVLSIAAGWTQAALEAALPSATGVVRAMPNTPAQVGEGVIAFCQAHTVAPERFEAIERVFSSCCRTFVVPESLLDAVIAVSGSGPAYVYVFIEALADAGVRQGLPRQMAYELAAQTLLGAARMVLETGAHPGALKDAVCSPGGTTIEAIYALEKAGLRGAVMDAVDACARKASALSK